MTLKTDYQVCLQKLDKQFEKFRKQKNPTRLQLARTKIQGQAFQNIHEDADIYLMSMPTGSGKTLCSAKCSLIKALETEKKHIIYVIPYNSIITQTAQELSIIFNDKDKGGRTVAHILRHQSIYSVEDDENADEAYKLQVNQATENWDADFIITTEVQFFETLFSNKRNQLRKMHNMADSILVFGIRCRYPAGKTVYLPSAEDCRSSPSRHNNSSAELSLMSPHRQSAGWISRKEQEQCAATSSRERRCVS